MANMTITKKAIRSAFIQVLNERPLSKITVKDITDCCGINRNTFYYHYQGIPELLEEVFTNEAERIVTEYPSLNSLEECLDTVMKFAIENKRAIMHIYSSDNWSVYVNSLWKICEYTVTAYVNTVLADTPLAERDKELIIWYHKCECFGLIVDWISHGMREEYLEGMHRICHLKKGATEELIRRSQEMPD